MNGPSGLPHVLACCKEAFSSKIRVTCVRFTGAMMPYPARAGGICVCDRNSIKRLLEAIASLLFWDQRLMVSGRWEIKGYF